jgi:hypothetical protein
MRVTRRRITISTGAKEAFAFESSGITIGFANGRAVDSASVGGYSIRCSPLIFPTVISSLSTVGRDDEAEDSPPCSGDDQRDARHRGQR